MEVPTGDNEDSPCIGAEPAPEVTLVQTDTETSPEAAQVYGSRWDS
jgi:hypothetical protein